MTQYQSSKISDLRKHERMYWVTVLWLTVFSASTCTLNVVGVNPEVPVPVKVLAWALHMGITLMTVYNISGWRKRADELCLKH